MAVSGSQASMNLAKSRDFNSGDFYVLFDVPSISLAGFLFSDG